MQIAILILIIIVIFQNFNNRSQIEKLKKKVSDQQIPYDHYSHLLKAYVGYYQWLILEQIKYGDSKVITKCISKLNKYFKDVEK